ncbi:response regulator [Desulfosporosinus lacus]|uniref:Stage 0 sporulation protein A homolog n=1 Tax=Desulfosporosinus lacus DSM 15449 TaxID=1121420 RepID=A0A1M5QP44_9FIRM|nr:response regulator [Desulfosporosinus lacus]SHH15706.1 two-component system, response regulator, stage 0 sporulation protein F [Desulfosporosinus lacus DSM 15449]
MNNTILVVDDHNGIRRLMCVFLQQEGFSVTEASNGLLALQLVMEEKPSLVLLDLRMPGLGGMETLAKLRELAPETIVVIMSAYYDSIEIKKALEERLFKYFIIKPFDLEEVGILIRGLMNKSEYHNAL